MPNVAKDSDRNLYLLNIFSGTKILRTLARNFQLLNIAKQSSKNANETINTPRNVIDKTLHASSSSIVSKHKKHESENNASTQHMEWKK